MTVEAMSMVEQGREKIGGVIAGKVMKKRRYRRRVRPRPAQVVPVALQKLFVSCGEVFKGPGTVPSPGDVQKLSEILDDMMPEDVGLSKDLLFFNKPKYATPAGDPRVTYTTIYQCRNFSLCIFFLPESAVIPLHNHPGMTVFSKLLLGTMHIKAYDWVNDPVISDDSTSPSHRRLARLKANKVFTAPCNTSVLYPTSGGNIHEFRAITACAVLDVLGPPYSKDDGRDCSYYKDFPCSALTISDRDGTPENEKEGSHDYGWLEEIEMPNESEMDVIQYLGPQVVETSF